MKYGFSCEIPPYAEPPVKEWLEELSIAAGHPVSLNEIHVEKHSAGPLEVVDTYVITYEDDRADTPQIQDSGDRTQFDSGAVRDMHEGKGRCDLLPMCALLRLARHYENGCKKYGDRNWEKGIPAHSFADSALRHMLKYMDGMDDEDHLIAAVWNLLGLAWTEEKHPEMMDIPARAGKADFTKMYVKVGT